MTPLLKLSNVHKHYVVKKKLLRAVENVSFEIYLGETLGLVGESGSGKTTIGHMLMKLIKPTSGEITFGADKMQMIFQDPYGSLNPRMTAGEMIEEPLKIYKYPKRKERVYDLLEKVGLSPASISLFPHEFSGGQRQRIAIARALALYPQFIVCDEPISALDVSIQAQIINLLKKLQEEEGLTYLFISHDLSMVKYLSNRVAVMYLGHLMELGTTEMLFRDPRHPYTQALLSANPIPDPEVERNKSRIILKGDIPSPLESFQGCPFASRCPKAQALCRMVKPAWEEVAPDHHVACHFSG